jgi:predicted TIM-barrel fold metal-dependent hydrolase
MAAMQRALSCVWLLVIASLAAAQDVKSSGVYQRLLDHFRAVRAVDTHDHLRDFEGMMQLHRAGDHGGMTLPALWQVSYLNWTYNLPGWPAGVELAAWWKQMEPALADRRANSSYRYLQIAFRDLHGIDFDGDVTLEQITAANERVAAAYRDEKWVNDVVTKRANIALMFCDSHWAPLETKTNWPFEVRVNRADAITRGFHIDNPETKNGNALTWARQHNIEVKSLDDYVALTDRIIGEAKAAGVAAFKTTMAYQRDLHFENVPKERAAAAFGRPAGELTPQQIRDFEDYMVWRVCELLAKHDLPFQIHTGGVRLQGSNPTLLMNLIEGNPKTKFILFHGGMPWVGESAFIVFRQRNVWLDSCWLPTTNYTLARRAYQEWLDVMPSDRIMWGADVANAEGVYGAAVMTRQCIAEALAEKVIRGEISERVAVRIGEQILRDNALKLFPKLRQRAG